jgi:hypothetical protein
LLYVTGCGFFANAGLVSIATMARTDKTNFVFNDFIVGFSIRAAHARTYAIFCTAQGDGSHDIVSERRSFAANLRDSLQWLFCGAISAKTRRKNSRVTTIDCVIHLASLPNAASIAGSATAQTLAVNQRIDIPGLRVLHCRHPADAGRGDIHARSGDL